LDYIAVGCLDDSLYLWYLAFYSGMLILISLVKNLFLLEMVMPWALLTLLSTENQHIWQLAAWIPQFEFMTSTHVV
jgi:hypothetical protein